jgi:hypothetical protein
MSKQNLRNTGRNGLMVMKEDVDLTIILKWVVY